VNFQITVLKILVSYPDGFAGMADLKRPTWRSWRPAARTGPTAPGDWLRVCRTSTSFRKALSRRKWRLEDHRQGARGPGSMEARPGAEQALETVPAEKVDAAVPPLPQPAERARRRRERRGEGRERARANAS
jgi:hypothetical protein